MKHLPAVLATVSAVAGFGLLEIYKTRFEQAVRGGASVGVLHLVRNVPAGRGLEETDVVIREIPARFVNQRGVRAEDLEEILGVRARTTLAEGDVLLYDDLALARAGGRDLAGLVPEGLRAVAITAPTFDGLLRPGDRVDVVTAGGRMSGEGPKVVVERSLILAVGGETSREAEGSRNGSIVLAVEPEDAKALSTAAKGGALMLGLRNPLDLATRSETVEGGSPSASPRVVPKPTREVERVR
jgi:Flp pilus assembly protein CpaB